MSEEIVNNKKNNGAYIAVIIILMVGVGILFFAWNNVRGELVKANNEVKKGNNKLIQMNNRMKEYFGSDSDDIAANFNLMLKDYAELKKNGTPEQIAAIEQQEAKIKALMAENEEMKSRDKLNVAFMSKLRRENDELRRIMKGYVYEIDSLNTLALNLRNDLDEKNICAGGNNHGSRSTSGKGRRSYTKGKRRTDVGG